MKTWCHVLSSKHPDAKNMMPKSLIQNTLVYNDKTMRGQRELPSRLAFKNITGVSMGGPYPREDIEDVERPQMRRRLTASFTTLPGGLARDNEAWSLMWTDGQLMWHSCP